MELFRSEEMQLMQVRNALVSRKFRVLAKQPLINWCKTLMINFSCSLTLRALFTLVVAADDSC
jgi:hypothetical protein